MMSGEKICVWPDGDWCYLSELSEMSHKSDDYEIHEAPEVEPLFSCPKCKGDFPQDFFAPSGLCRTCERKVWQDDHNSGKNNFF